MSWRVPVETETESKGQKLANRNQKTISGRFTNNPVIFTVPQGVVWTIKSIGIGANSSSFYGSKWVHVQCVRPSATYDLWDAYSNIFTRGQLGFFVFAPDVSDNFITNPAASFFVFYGSTSIPDLQYRPGDQIIIVIENGVLGDTLVIEMTYEETAMESF